MTLATFWLIIAITCLVWYSTITVYVSVRGIWDIRSMFARLGALRDDAEKPHPAEPD
ncbi:MAG: hypothetical protein AB7O59_13705 [Pirellulales bacterium]